MNVLPILNKTPSPFTALLPGTDPALLQAPLMHMVYEVKCVVHHVTQKGSFPRIGAHSGREGTEKCDPLWQEMAATTFSALKSRSSSLNLKEIIWQIIGSQLSKKP